MNTNPKNSLLILAAVISGFVLVAVYVRLFFSVEMTDESQYLAEALSPLIGGQPFVTDPFIQQTASILFTPIISIFVKVVGSTKGLALFARHIYFVLALLAASSVFYFFSKRIHKLYALLIASTVVAFVPLAIPSISYNAIANFSLCSGLFLSTMAFETLSRRLSLLAGIVFAVCVFSYPPTLVIVVLVAFCIHRLSVVEGKSLEIRRCFLPGVGAFLLLSFIGLLVILSFGFENIKASYAMTHTLSSSVSMNKVMYVYNSFQHYGSLGAILCAVAVILLGRRLGRIRFGLAFLAGLAYYILVFPEDSGFPFYQFLLTETALLALAMYFLDPDSRSQKNIFRLLMIPSMVSIFIFVLFSGNGLATGAIGALASCLVLQYFFLWPIPARPMDQMISFVSAAALTIAVVSGLYGFTYRDHHISQLDTRVESGPYSGLYTTPLRAKVLTFLEKDLEAASKNRESIFSYDFFPAGYLFFPLVPKTQMFFLPRVYDPPSTMRENLIKFFSKEENLPDVVLEMFVFPWYGPYNFASYNPKDSNPHNDPFKDFFIKTGKYKNFVTRPFYQIHVRDRN